MTNRSIDAVVFDLGNVLMEWDRERLYGRLIPDVAARRQFLDEVLTIPVNERLDRGEPFGLVLGELASQYPEHREQILAFESNWSETLGPADDDVVEILRRLRGRVPLVVLTNFAASTFLVALERFAWLDWFDHLVVSGREGVIKPEPEIYALVEDRTGVAADRLWFTDDNQGNIEAARARGWQAELFEGAHGVRASLGRAGLEV